MGCLNLHGIQLEYFCYNDIQSDIIFNFICQEKFVWPIKSSDLRALEWHQNDSAAFKSLTNVLFQLTVKKNNNLKKRSKHRA